HRLVALLSYPDSADVEALTRDFMAGSEFAADMDGFDPQDIVAVDPMRPDPDSVGAGRRKDRRLPRPCGVSSVSSPRRGPRCCTAVDAAGGQPCWMLLE